MENHDLQAASRGRRTRVKICGITRPEHAVQAALLGADAIGLVFYPASPRAVSIAQANLILDALPPLVTRVGLFVDAAVEQVMAVLQQVSLDLLQFHGEEPEAYCRQFRRPYLKALSMRSDRDVAAAMAAYPSAAGLLLDTYHPAMPGGSGERFDWDQIPAERPRPLILAGGLQAENVAEAICRVRPFGVDVSSGVESGKGIKDADKIAAFIRGVERGDHTTGN